MSPAQVFDPGSSFTSRIRWPTVLGQPAPSVALPRGLAQMPERQNARTPERVKVGYAPFTGSKLLCG
jgi:hypothetical protein